MSPSHQARRGLGPVLRILCATPHVPEGGLREGRGCPLLVRSSSPASGGAHTCDAAGTARRTGASGIADSSKRPGAGVKRHPRCRLLLRHPDKLSLQGGKEAANAGEEFIVSDDRDTTEGGSKELE